jgi:hypothetical protein
MGFFEKRGEDLRVWRASSLFSYFAGGDRVVVFRLAADRAGNDPGDIQIAVYRWV